MGEFKSFWKPAPISRKVRKGIARRKIDAVEDENKKAVRVRDRGCRVPMCGCRKFNLARHVSHKRHKGAGGNPTGERSDPRMMVYVCSARHRENRVSIDRGTLEWRPRSERLGADGPLTWWVDLRALEHGPAALVGPPSWFCVAIETSGKRISRASGFMLEPLTDKQRAVLTKLAEMEL